MILKRKYETTDRSLKVSEIIRKAVSEVLVRNEFPINPSFNFPLSVVNVEMNKDLKIAYVYVLTCLLYTSPSPRDLSTSRMPSSA